MKWGFGYFVSIFFVCKNEKISHPKHRKSFHIFSTDINENIPFSENKPTRLFGHTIRVDKCRYNKRGVIHSKQSLQACCIFTAIILARISSTNNFTASSNRYINLNVVNTYICIAVSFSKSFFEVDLVKIDMEMFFNKNLINFF